MAEGDELTLSDDEGEEPDEGLPTEIAALDLERGGEDAAAPTSSTDERDAEIERLRSELDDARRGVDSERAARGEAVARYRDAVLAANPALPPELVTGDTLEAVDASLDEARRAVAQIRERLAQEDAEAASRGFPAGAPGRLQPDPGAMSPTEKIAYGLERASS